MSGVEPTSYNGSDSDATQCRDDNISCYDLAEVPAALAVHSFFLALIGIVSLLANGLVFLLVAKYKRLRTNHSNLLALLLVASDLSLTFTYILPTFTTAVLKDWVYGERGCVAFGFLAAYVLLVRWMVISVFCIDRFCTVRFPFRYQNRRRKIVLLILSFAAWFLPAVASVIPIHIFSCFSLRTNIPTCLPSCMTRDYSSLCKIYYAFTSVISFFMGSILPTLIYIWLYRKGRTARTSMRNSIGHITVQIAGTVVKKPYVDYKSVDDRDRRATATFMLVFLTVLVTATPSFLAQAIRAVNVEFHCSWPIYIHFAIHQLLLFAFILNPILIMRDPDFRHCLKLLFCKNRHGSTTDAVASTGFNNKVPDQVQEIDIPNHKEVQCLQEKLSDSQIPHVQVTTAKENIKRDSVGTVSCSSV